MSCLEDPIAKQHAGYFFLLFATWVACCVVFGGELHRATIKGTVVDHQQTQTVTTVTDGTYSMYYDHYSVSQTVTTTTASTSGSSTTVNPQPGGSVNYQQCTGSICNKCYSGGAGAVAMAVFCWFCLTFAALLRVLVLWQKHTQVPRLGESDATYALVEASRTTPRWASSSSPSCRGRVAVWRTPPPAMACRRSFPRGWCIWCCASLRLPVPFI